MKGKEVKNPNDGWKKIATFGEGIIYAKGEERKVVSPDGSEFKYTIKVDLDKSKIISNS